MMLVIQSLPNTSVISCRVMSWLVDTLAELENAHWLMMFGLYASGHEGFSIGNPPQK